MTLSSHTLTLDEEAKISARRIFSLIANELQQVEIEFERQARSNVQVIAYLADYLRKSGGKRVRPALTILSNYAVGGEGSRGRPHGCRRQKDRGKPNRPIHPPVPPMNCR